MATIYHEICELLFGNGMVSSMTKWMNQVWGALDKMVNSGFTTNILSVFGAVAASLLILYFSMEMVNQASKDMFSFEKFVIACIKAFIAVVIIICLPEILDSMIKLGKAMYEWCASDQFGKDLLGKTKDSGLKFCLGGKDNPVEGVPSAEALSDAGVGDFGLSHIFDHFQAIIIGMICMLISFIVKLVGYFVTTSNALSIIARAIFSPIAVCQLFEDGSRSVGVRYLKTFAVECLNMAVIVVILRVSQIFTGYMMASVYKGMKMSTIDFAKIEDYIQISAIAQLILPQLACVGALMGANKITKDMIM